MSASYWSLTIYYDPDSITWKKIVYLLEEKGWFKLAEAKTGDEVIEQESEKVIAAAINIVETIEGGTE